MDFVAVKKRRFADELARAGLQGPLEIDRQAPVASLAWRILNSGALNTSL